MHLPHASARSKTAAPTFRILGTALLLAIGGSSPARGADAIEYNRDVRPILADNCFACHGADSAARKADLRLDHRKDAVDSGAIQPQAPEESELIARISTTDPEELMPPPTTGKKLTAEQKEILRKWIAGGAEYQPHWSFIAPVRPPLPEVRDAAWVRNPIDRFVLARLESNGLHPAPEADRRTLARRLSLDLTGLPPDPADVDRFVVDHDPEAYADYVDRLLKSPRWGEHRAKYWLDAARYADTHGYHFDNFREMWSYRDWVINAFNRNMRFDQFTIEQLAGDLLPDRTIDQQIASGFNRCNMTTNEGGVIPEEFAVLYTRDRTETASQIWLGLTTGCAVCHDHKFDPISQANFYELSAFFNNTTQNTMDGNIRDTPPIIVVPAAADRDRWMTLQAELRDIQGKIDTRAQAAKGDFETWLSALTTKPESLATLSPAEGLKLRVRMTPTLAPDPIKAVTSHPPGEGPTLEITEAGDFERDQAFSFGGWIKLGKKRVTGSVVGRIDDRKAGTRGWELWLEDSKVGVHLAHKWPEDGIKVLTSSNEVPRDVWTHVFVTYDGSSQAGGIKVYINGQPQALGVHANSLKNSIRVDVPLKVGQRQVGAKIGALGLHDLRIYGRALSGEEVERLSGASRAAELVRKPAAQRESAEAEAVYAWWLRAIDPVLKESRGRRSKIDQEIATIKTRGTIAHVAQERMEPAVAYVLHRGDYDKRREAVKPNTPGALPPMPADLPRNRLGLAKWLLLPENPMTARVTVNRFWQEVFGTGIVRTSGDFGTTGELPSHPELLDWLAVEFRESGWDVRRLFKLIVTSATYRQSAAATPEKLEKDLANRLFSRGPRFRMDAEVIRDYALEAGGLLADKLGGPSVRPYQPEGVWEAVAMPESNTHFYKRDAGEALYRRSLYTFWKRAAPPAAMDIFNAPSREVCTVRRERTNTPLQALATLNAPQFVEAAKALAQLTLNQTVALDPKNIEARVDVMAKRLLARSLRPEEMTVVRDSLTRLLSAYRSHPDDAAKLLAVGELKVDPKADLPTLAAWTMLANELLNLDEVLNK
jgi:hypothetical protein